MHSEKAGRRRRSEEEKNEKQEIVVNPAVLKQMEMHEEADRDTRTLYRLRLEKWEKCEQELKKLKGDRDDNFNLHYRAYMAQVRMYASLVRSGLIPMPRGIPEHIVEYKRKVNLLFGPVQTNG